MIKVYWMWSQGTGVQHAPPCFDTKHYTRLQQIMPCLNESCFKTSTPLVVRLWDRRRVFQLGLVKWLWRFERGGNAVSLWWKVRVWKLSVWLEASENGMWVVCSPSWQLFIIQWAWDADTQTSCLMTSSHAKWLDRSLLRPSWDKTEHWTFLLYDIRISMSEI